MGETPIGEDFDEVVAGDGEGDIRRLSVEVELPVRVRTGSLPLGARRVDVVEADAFEEDLGLTEPRAVIGCSGPDASSTMRDDVLAGISDCSASVGDSSRGGKSREVPKLASSRTSSNS